MKYTEAKCLDGRNSTTGNDLDEEIISSKLEYDNPCEPSVLPRREKYDSPSWFPPPYDEVLCSEEEILKREETILQNLSLIIIRSEKGVVTQENETEDSVFLELPSDVVDLIAKKLPLFDYWSFRSTCKMLRTAFPAKPELRSPLFVYLRNTSVGLYEVKDRNQKGSCSGNLEPRHPCISTILASTRNGWLLTKSEQDKSLYGFNIFTNRSYYINNSNNTYLGHHIVPCLKVVGFLDYPTCGYSTVGYCRGPEPNSLDTIAFFSPGFNIWRHWLIRQNFSENPTSVVHHKGGFYFMDRLGYLGKFSFNIGEQATWSNCGKQVKISEAWCQILSSHLIECDDELLSVFIGFVEDKSNGNNKALKGGVGAARIKVFKYHSSTNKWMEIKSLGEFSLFIGPTSFSVIPRESETRNRIYLPWMQANDIVYYSLETSKFYVAGDHKRTEDTWMRKLCCWI